MKNTIIKDAVAEIVFARDECVGVLDSLKKFCPPDSNGNYPGTFRLLATPMFYSVWERCFTACHAITLRLLRDSTSKASELEITQRAAWLLRAPFYQSFCSRLKDWNMEIDHSKGTKKGQFVITVEFLAALEQWTNLPIDQATDAEEIVMTYSNVNPDVVNVNALAVGIDAHNDFKKIKFGRLHDLVGMRNGIGHGAIIAPPSNDQFCNLFEFTEDLILDYSAAFITWINSITPSISHPSLEPVQIDSTSPS